MHAIRWFLCLCAFAGPVSAAEPDATTSRLSLRNVSVEPAPQRSSRYRLQARFAPQASAGELREGGSFSLIGRFAKASVSCTIDSSIFKNGFEGS